MTSEVFMVGVEKRTKDRANKHKHRPHTVHFVADDVFGITLYNSEHYVQVVSEHT